MTQSQCCCGETEAVLQMKSLESGPALAGRPERLPAREGFVWVAGGFSLRYWARVPI